MKSNILDYRDLIFYKAWADLRAEARRYYISYAWWIIEPILEMLVFYLVFSVLLSRGGPNFVQFLLIGLIAWKWFAQTVQHCGNSITNAKGLILQTSLPKIIFPTIFIITDTFKACIASGIILVFLLGSGFSPNPAYLALPLLIAVQLLLITAVGYCLAAVVPYLPDLGILISHLLRMLFFLSGIFWDPNNIISETYRELFFLNPMARLINDYRGILLHERLPEPVPLLIIAIISVMVIVAAARFIRIRDTHYPRIVNQ
jgi:lipopolysaccharide transport system permease protein